MILLREIFLKLRRKQIGARDIIVAGKDPNKAREKMQKNWKINFRSRKGGRKMNEIQNYQRKKRDVIEERKKKSENHFGKREFGENEFL